MRRYRQRAAPEHGIADAGIGAPLEGRDDDFVAADADDLAETRAEAAALLEFLGLDWEDAVLDSTRGGAIRTPSNWQVREPLYRESSGRWHNYAAQLDKLLD